MHIPATHPLAQAFSLVVSGLCAVVADRSARVPLLAPLLVLVHHRLARMIHRLDAIARHVEARILRMPRLRPAARVPSPQAPCAQRPYIPTGRFSLILLAQRTAQYTGQVQAFLATPETRALVAAAPQAGRVLRPLCRMLGLTPPDYLRLPPRARPRARTAALPPASPPPAPAPRPRRPALVAYLADLTRRARLAALQAPGPDFLASHVFRT